MSLAIDRLSGEKLLELGIATRFAVMPPTPAEKAEATFPAIRIAAEIPGIIYILQAPPIMPVKIGFTRAAELTYRVKSLQTGCPYPLLIIAQTTGLPAREREIHALLDADRLTGEWFDWTPRVRAFVESL